MKHKPNIPASKGQGKKQKKEVYSGSHALTRGTPPGGHRCSWSAARTPPKDSPPAGWPETHDACGLAGKDELHQPERLLGNLQLGNRIHTNGDQVMEP